MTTSFVLPAGSIVGGVNVTPFPLTLMPVMEARLRGDVIVTAITSPAKWTAAVCPVPVAMFEFWALYAPAILRTPSTGNQHR